MGISVDRVINDYARKEARYADSVTANLEGYRQNAESQKGAVESRRQGRVVSLAPYISAPVEQPDYVGAALRSGMVGYRAYQRLEKK